MTAPSNTTQTSRRGRPRKYQVDTSLPRLEPAEPAVYRAGDAIPETVLSLQWDDAPSVLLIEEAAVLLRVSRATMQEWIVRQRVQVSHGHPPENPLPVLSADRVVRIDRDLLREWMRRECLPSADYSPEHNEQSGREGEL